MYHTRWQGERGGGVEGGVEARKEASQSLRGQRSHAKSLKSSASHAKRDDVEVREVMIVAGERSEAWNGRRE